MPISIGIENLFALRQVSKGIWCKKPLVFPMASVAAEDGDELPYYDLGTAWNIEWRMQSFVPVCFFEFIRGFRSVDQVLPLGMHGGYLMIL